MPRQILLNLLIGFVWMFLENSWSFLTFVVGYLIGLMLLFGLRRFLPERLYIANIVAIIHLLYIFLKELLLANIIVIKHVLSPQLTIRPGIIAFPTVLKKEWQITALANLVTLTPGSVVIDISPDNKILYIHSMDIDTQEKTINEIKDTFEKAILEVSR